MFLYSPIYDLLRTPVIFQRFPRESINDLVEIPRILYARWVSRMLI